MAMAKGQYTEYTDSIDNYGRPEKLDGTSAILYQILSLFFTPPKSNAEVPDLNFHHENILFMAMSDEGIGELNLQFNDYMKRLYPGVKIYGKFYKSETEPYGTVALDLIIDGTRFNYVSNKVGNEIKWLSRKDFTT